MLRSFLPLGILSAFLVGCEVTEKTALDKASEMIATQLKDPGSAKFSELKFVEDKVIGDTRYGYICGIVNSRNSFGGYGGGVRFTANLNYSKKGSIAIKYLELEEGTNAENMSEEKTYFEHFYWNKRCFPGVSTRLEVGQRSKPAKMVLTPRVQPDVFSSETAPIPVGEVVTVYALKDGWAQVSADLKTPKWIIPELLDW